MKNNKTVHAKRKKADSRRSYYREESFVSSEPELDSYRDSAEGERRRLVETFRDMGIEV